MDDEQKAQVVGWLTFGMVFLGGYLIGRSSRSRKQPKRQVLKAGTYVDGDRTSSVLMSVGMQALVDGLYDEYELEDILSKSNI